MEGEGDADSARGHAAGGRQGERKSERGRESVSQLVLEGGLSARG
jgi:hypothetical protein